MVQGDDVVPRLNQARRDLAADTVIGFVLVTGISISMITIVMLMGVPALDQVQSRQQADSMVGAFQRLDRAVTQLISGAPSGTTPAWQVSMARGSLDVPQGGEHVWGYAVNFTRDGDDYHFWFGEYSDGDDELQIRNTGAAFGAGDFRIKAWRWNGDQATDPHIMEDTSFPTDSTNTTTLPWFLEGNTTQLELRNDDTGKVVAEAWFVDGGAIEWSLRASQLTQVYYQNTGIIMDIDDGQVFHNTPRIRAPQDQGDGESVFFRVVKFNGSLALGGRSSGEVLLNSQGSHSRFSSGDVGEVQIYPPTSTVDSWCRRLTDTTRGYTYDWTNSDATDAPCDGVAESTDPSVFLDEEGAITRSNSSFAGDLSTTFVETGIEAKLVGSG